MSIFLSFTEAAEPLALQLAEKLDERGLEVTNVGEDIPAGSNWALELGLALERSDAMVVLLTPDALESRHVDREINFALLNRRFKHRLIPVTDGVSRVPWLLGGVAPIDMARGVDAVADAIAAHLLQQLQPA